MNADVRTSRGIRGIAPVADLVRGLNPDRRKSIQYARQTTEVLERVIQSASVGIDLWAGHGAVLRELTRLAPRAPHIAVAPRPDVAADLRGAFPRVTVHCADLSRRAAGVRVQDLAAVRRLDDLVPAEAPVAFIRAVTGGGEYEALRGGAGTLRRCRPVVVFEAGSRPPRHRGANARMFFDLFQGLGMGLSTLDDFLEGAPPLSLAEFAGAWATDYTFVAYAA